MAKVKNVRLGLLLGIVGLALVLSVGYCFTIANRADAATGAVATTRTVSVCDESHLKAAIGGANSGDTVNLSCSGIITLTATIDISKNLILDGMSHNIALSGNYKLIVLNVLTDTNFTLNNLTITEGEPSDPNCITGSSICGGGIHNSGNLTITNSTFTSNLGANGGGAIFNSASGRLTVTNSTFSFNAAGSGGAIYNAGTLNINNSNFSSNAAGSVSGFGDGIINNATGANLHITDSSFSSNSDVVIYNRGNVTINNSNFSNNSPGTYSPSVVFNFGDTVISNSTFNSNTGGVILNYDSMSINSSTFISNTFTSSAGTVHNTGNLSVSSSTFISNSVIVTDVAQTSIVSGGAIYNDYGSTNILSSAFISNSANFGGAIFNSGDNVNVVNSTFISNSANFGGAIFNVGNTLNIINSTFVSNSIKRVGAIHISNSRYFSTNTTIANSILANSGGNCAISTGGVLTDGGYNLSDDNSCTFSSASSKNNVSNLNLDTLKNNGGPSQTIALLSGSVAIGSVAIGCPTVDQRGNVRPTTNCSAGAYEPLSPTPTLAVFSGSGQTTPISTAFPVTLAAIVRDANTNSPLPNVTVTFQAPATGASGIFSPTNASIFTATTDANGIATASSFVANSLTGSYQVTATISGTGAVATFNLINSSANSPSGYTYFLPFLANAYQPAGTTGSFTTYLVFQNTSNQITSTVSLNFFDNNGNSIATAPNTCQSVAPLGECIVPNPFASGQQGEAILTSSQPLNVIVSEATPFGGSAYAVSPGAANTLIAPVAIRGGLLDFTTQLNIFNAGSSPVTGTVQFYDQNGNHITVADKFFTLLPHSTTTYDQATDTDLGNSYYGWAQITSPAGSTLVAQILEQRPSVKFVAIVNAQFNPQTTLYAPAIFNNAFGGFVTGTNLVNPSSQPVSVTISYYRNDGTLFYAAPFSIAPDGIVSIFQGAASGNSLPVGGLPADSGGGWYGSATIRVSGGSGLVMFVNEQGGLTANGNSQSGTYGAALSGANQVSLPVMANGAFGGYITGATIENIASSSVTVTVQYYDTNGQAVGISQILTIAGHASAALYQGDTSQALPLGFYGTAQISVSGGTSSSLLVTTNAQSSTFFYSYTEPS